VPDTAGESRLDPPLFNLRLTGMSEAVRMLAMIPGAAMETDWEGLIDLAGKQLGLISRAQIEAAGFSVGITRARLRDREWVRIHRGWFKLGNAPMTADQKVLATMLIAGPEAVISHMTAARILRLDVPRTQLVDISVPNHCHGARYEMPRIFRARDLRPYHYFRDGPLRVTTIERTVLDCASFLRGRWLSALFYSAVRHGQATVDRLRNLVDEQGYGRTGSGRLSAVLTAYDRSSAAPQSVPESFLVELVREVGLTPTPQYALGPKHHVDLAWPEHKVAVEVDSWRYHGSFFAYSNDRARDRAAARAGWVTLRFTYDEIVALPRRVISDICAVLELRARRAA
jgi:very-short-patch-repair endonuclease